MRGMVGGVSYALCAVALWSTNALAAGFALGGLGLIQVLALQFGAAAVVISLARVFTSSGGTSSISESGGLIHGIIVGIIGLTGTIFLQYLAFATAPMIEANVIAYGWPLFAAVWFAITLRTRRTLAGIPLAVTGFTGVAVIFASGSISGGEEGGVIGYSAALASAFCMTFYTVASGRLKTSGYVLLLPATLLGAVSMLSIGVLGAADWKFVSPGAWMWAIYAGVGPMAGGFFLWSRAMSGEGAERLAPLGYATPLLSTLLLLAFGETLAPGAFVGIALILTCSIGVLAVNRSAQ